MSSVARRIAMNYRQRAPRCESCANFKWLPESGGPYCTLGEFHVKPIGLCSRWTTAKRSKAKPVVPALCGNDAETDAEKTKEKPLKSTA